MHQVISRTLATASIAAVIVAGCGTPSGGVAGAEFEPPVVVEEIEGSELHRLTLSKRAAERLGIETAEVVEERVGSEVLSVIPYSGIVYDADGSTWTYTNPDGFVFVRVGVTVDRIDGGTARLSVGPPVGTRVVTVAAAELWGVETGVGGGH